MKAHVGVDSEHKLIHSVVATAANVADSQVLPDLLPGQERRVYGDQAYRGQGDVIRGHAPQAKDFTNRGYRHNGAVDQVQKAKNRTKSRVRAKVEHPIGVIKRILGFVKVRYRGLGEERKPAVCNLRGWPICTWCAANCCNFRGLSASAVR
jgi:transposase, IS5 family